MAASTPKAPPIADGTFIVTSSPSAAPPSHVDLNIDDYDYHMYGQDYYDPEAGFTVLDAGSVVSMGCGTITDNSSAGNAFDSDGFMKSNKTIDPDGFVTTVVTNRGK